VTATAAMATQYPLVIRDITGKEITIEKEPQRVSLQDGRDIYTLALLDRDNPFKRIVSWTEVVHKTSPESLKTLAEKWGADMDEVISLGKHKRDINIEYLLKSNPDIMIAQYRIEPYLRESGLISTLNKSNIPIVFIDTFEDPINNTSKSIEILGKILNKERESLEFIDFNNRHIEGIKRKIKNLKNKPLVFVEAKAGVAGLDSCCFTHASIGWGKLIEAVGAKNLGSALLPGNVGQISMEKVIAENPDIYILTGARWAKKTNASLPLGYETNEQQIQEAFTSLVNRVGFKQLKAFKKKRVYGMYHQFYNHTYNIVALEYLAKIIHPEIFKELEPQQTYDYIINNLTRLPENNYIFSAQYIKK